MAQGPRLVVDNDNQRLRLFQSDEEFRATSRFAKASNLLTSRQRQVFECVAKGMDTKTISRVVGIAPGTVKVHLASIYQVLQVSNRQVLAACLGGMDETWKPWEQARRSGEYMASNAKSIDFPDKKK